MSRKKPRYEWVKIRKILLRAMRNEARREADKRKKEAREGVAMFHYGVWFRRTSKQGWRRTLKGERKGTII